MLSICYMTWPLLWSEHLREFNTTNNNMRLPSASRARSNSDALKTPVPSSSRIMNACCRTHRKLTQVHVYRYITFPINFMHKLKLCQHKNLNKQCKTRSRQRHNMSVKRLQWWAFSKVTQGQWNTAILLAPYHFLLVFCKNNASITNKYHFWDITYSSRSQNACARRVCRHRWMNVFIA